MLETWGYTEEQATHFSAEGLDKQDIARVIAVHRDSYIIGTDAGSCRAEVTGQLRYTAGSGTDFPAVGDWVHVAGADSEFAVILRVLGRRTQLERQRAGTQGESQLIAANIDVGFATMSLDANFKLNRVDRYVALCRAGGIEPVVLLTKSDLLSPEEMEGKRAQVKERQPGVEVLSLSIEDESSVKTLLSHMQSGRTYCFLGSSGVGKSTLVNRLLEKEALKTAEISQSHGKGRHTTTHRELFVLPGGAIVIDTPGMREVGMTDAGEGIESAFDRIAQLAAQCRYADCSHTGETGCAVLEALEAGDLPETEYESFQKLKREQEHFAETAHEKRKKGKEFSRMVKDMKGKHDKYRR